MSCPMDFVVWTTVFTCPYFDPRSSWIVVLITTAERVCGTSSSKAPTVTNISTFIALAISATSLVYVRHFKCGSLPIRNTMSGESSDSDL